MAKFYTNITLTAATAGAAAKELTALSRQAYLADLGPRCVVYDREGDRQEPRALAALAAQLGARLDTPAFAVLNNDDDRLWFQCYDRGVLVAEYANRGGPRTDVNALCRALQRPREVTAVWLLLRLPFVHETTRHRRLAHRLGLPAVAVGFGFNYLERGEIPDGLKPRQLLRVR